MQIQFFVMLQLCKLYTRKEHIICSYCMKTNNSQRSTPNVEFKGNRELFTDLNIYDRSSIFAKNCVFEPSFYFVKFVKLKLVNTVHFLKVHNNRNTLFINFITLDNLIVTCRSQSSFTTKGT